MANVFVTLVEVFACGKESGFLIERSGPSALAVLEGLIPQGLRVRRGALGWASVYVVSGDEILLEFGCVIESWTSRCRGRLADDHPAVYKGKRVV